MLGGAWLWIVAALLLVALVLHQVALLLVAVLFFLASSAARLWARYSLEGVEFERGLSTNRAFFGETITLETRIANRKLLPLPWLSIHDEMPAEVELLKGKVSPYHKPTRRVLSHFISLGWYQRLTRRHLVRCLRRGYFTFGPAVVRSGDPFGFFEREAVEEKLDRLLVYPRIVPLERLGIPSRYPFGDLRVRRHLFEDPVVVAGIRDYAHGDPLRRIHWKASARLQRLQIRVFEATTTVDLGLFLDVTTIKPPLRGLNEQLLETAVIVAASVTNYSLAEGYRVGLYVNEPYRYSGQMVRLPPSDHPDQLRRALEALAHVRGWPLVPIEETLRREARALPWSTTLAVITAVPTDSLLASLHRFSRSGRRVALLVVGGEAGRETMDTIPIYHISDKVYWEELSAVRLEGGGK